VPSVTDAEIKIIRHLPSGIDVADDPSLAFLVEVNLRPPGIMSVAFAMRCGGSEHLVARCATRAAVDRFFDRTAFRDHPRLRWIKVTGPDGAVETFEGRT